MRQTQTDILMFHLVLSCNVPLKYPISHVGLLLVLTLSIKDFTPRVMSGRLTSQRNFLKWMLIRKLFSRCGEKRTTSESEMIQLSNTWG